MMLIKFVLICSLLASPTFAASGIKGITSDIKGGGQRQWDIKSARTNEQLAVSKIEQQTLPITKSADRVEQQREQVHTKRTEQKDERYSAKFASEPQLQLAEEQRQEPLIEQKETKGTAAAHFEARPQISRDDTKGGARLEQQREEQMPLAAATKEAAPGDWDKLEQQKLEQTRVEQQKLEQTRLEPQKLEQEKLEQQRDEQQQAVELSRDLYEQRRVGDQYLIAQQREESTKGQASIGAQQQLVAEPEPYAFDYSVAGSTRRESGDTKGVVRGQYTLQGADGSSRVVDYIADHNGFRAIVNTNEFGTESRSSAGVEVRSSQPAAEDISLRLEGKTRESLAAPASKGAAPLEAPKRPDNWSVKQAPVELLTPVAAPPLPVPQVVEESPRAIRGKTIEEIRAPAKGREQLSQKWDEGELAGQQKEKLAAEHQSELLEPKETKGELRAPKQIPLGEQKRAAQVANEPLVSQLRAPSTFESATAHRVVLSPTSVHRNQQYRPAVRAASAPAAPVHQRLQPVRAQYHQLPATGTVLQHHQTSRHEPSARLSFYGSNIESVDDSAASFEHPVGE